MSVAVAIPKNTENSTAARPYPAGLSSLPSGIHGKQGTKHEQEPVLHHLLKATTFEQCIYGLREGKCYRNTINLLRAPGENIMKSDEYRIGDE